MKNPGLEMAKIHVVQTLRLTDDLIEYGQNNATLYVETMQKSLAEKGFSTDLKFKMSTVSLRY